MSDCSWVLFLGDGIKSLTERYVLVMNAEYTFWQIVANSN
jgi:hypothetical protein